MTRFSDRVSDYVMYRPGYPKATVSWLIKETGLTGESVVADIGSGTGIFTACLLGRVKTVYAVEPNGPMRSAAEESCGGKEGFVSVDGASEKTGLPQASVDLVTAAQAFHWFQLPQTLEEFRRILRPGRPVALIWNERQNTTLFLKKYEQALVKWSKDYQEVNHGNIAESDIRKYFPGGVKIQTFDYRQTFDRNGLIGRMLSSSYCPNRLDERFPFLEKEVLDAFDEHQESGVIPFIYKTIAYLGYF